MTERTTGERAAIEQAMMQQVLASLDTTPETPPTGTGLSLPEAEAIVAAALEALRNAQGDPVQLRYLTGHARRLAQTLVMIPRAPHPEARLLDVGCYGLMAFWAAKHLGYAEVVGIELLPDEAETVVRRRIEVGAEAVEFTVHNLDITRPDWPLDGPFDTILLLETLEHVNEDPSGILTCIVARLAVDGVFVASVPNCLSYKGMQEVLTGAPPWTYWFYHPDLRHEPRHAFEYTPIFFKTILRAAGLRETAFRTIYAYREQDHLGDLQAIGRLFSIPDRLFGDTMIARMRRDPALPVERHPGAIYDLERYYEAAWPLLRPRELAATRHVLDAIAARDEIEALRQRLAEAEARLAEIKALADTLRVRLVEVRDLAEGIRAGTEASGGNTGRS